MTSFYSLFYANPNWVGKTVTSLSIIAALFASGAASAAIVSGEVLIIDPPSSVRPDQTTGDRNAKLFQEQQALHVSTAFPVDTMAFPGLYDDLTDFQSGQLPAGNYNSFFLHADATATVGRDGFEFQRDYRGSITFDTPILGVVALADTFLATKPIFKAPDTRYPLRRERAHDLDFKMTPNEPSGRLMDTFELSPDLRTLSFDWSTAGSLDQMRIITAVPEPSSALSLIAVLSGLLFVPGIRRAIG